mgnify:FL=1
MAKDTTREADFTTIRIRKKDKADLEELALPREALWETVKRMKDSFTVKRMAQRKK